jgi:hypothetical protein
MGIEQELSLNQGISISLIIAFPLGFRGRLNGGGGESQKPKDPRHLLSSKIDFSALRHSF